jgi:hypothetical protein
MAIAEGEANRKADVEHHKKVKTRGKNKHKINVEQIVTDKPEPQVAPPTSPDYKEPEYLGAPVCLIRDMVQQDPDFRIEFRHILLDEMTKKRS